MDDATPTPTLARQQRRQRQQSRERLTAAAHGDETPGSDTATTPTSTTDPQWEQQISSPTDNDGVNGPSDINGQDTLKRKRRQRRATPTGELAPPIVPEVDLLDTTTPATRRQRRQDATTIIAIASPTGDERAVIDASDLISSPTAAASSTPTLATNTTPMDQSTVPYFRPADPVIIVEDKQKFRAVNRAAYDEMMAGDPAGADGVAAIDESVEAQVGAMLKRVNLYFLAISYLSFGVLAGIGLMTLLVFDPLPPLSLESSLTDPVAASMPASSTFAYLSYEAAPLVQFVGWYGPVSKLLSSVLSVLISIIVIYAMDTKASQRHTARAVLPNANDKNNSGSTTTNNNNNPTSNSSTNNNNNAITAQPPPQTMSRREKRRLRQRTRVTSLLVALTWLSFLAHIISESVDSRLGNVTLDTNGTTGNVIFKIGPYYDATDPSATINAPAGQKLVLDWVWYYIIGDGRLTGLPQRLCFDLTLWTVTRWVRGVALMLCWAVALVEIKLRGGSGGGGKKKPVVPV